MVCALAAETKEAEYMSMIERHKKGKRGQRGIDLMPQMFGELVIAMTRTDADILGDLFQGSVTYGESGQYFSPASIAALLAEMSVDPDARPTRDVPIYVHDCCCGTGRMLLEAANVNPYVELVGQDIDARCVKITAINMGLRSRYGWVVCGNSLSGVIQFAYRVGSFFHETSNGLRRGVICDVPPEQTPIPVLAERTRRKARDLFEQADTTEAEGQSSIPTIIEMPQWLARLEPKLAAFNRSDPAIVEERSEQVRPRPEDAPPKQQELF